MSSDRDIISWDKRLMDQYKRQWENYLRRRIHLDDARALERMTATGDFLYVEDVSSTAAFADIRLNRNTNEPIDLELGTIIKTVFTEFYITNAALQGEWIDLIIGINFEYYRMTAAGGGVAANVTVVNAAGAAAVNIQDGGNSITVDAAALPLPAGAATAANQLPDGHNVTVDNAAGAAAVNIQDGGNSITVDAAALPLPAGAATAANQLPDGHNVTVDNAAGAAAVNIQDGGNSITVDGAVTAVDDGVAQPVIMITHANADTDVTGANNACKRALIRALTTNTGLTWVNFSAAAVDGTSYPLDTGDAISVPITNTNLIHCLFKVGGEKVAVVYQN